MWIWIALGAVALAVAVIVMRRQGERPTPAAEAGHGLRMTAKRPRVTWPPGYSDTRPIRTVRRPDSLYLIEEFENRAEALAFLRGCEVRDERVYVIAENPQGNLGKDLVMVFEEADGAFVEIAERTALPTPRYSSEDCARCGYSVIPAASPGFSDSSEEHGSTWWFLSLEDMEMGGHGEQCKSCGALGCARCHRAVPQQRNADGSLDLRCWMCDGEMDVFTE
ncbi:hypothetical protein [Glycomyces tarimensis]